MNFVSKFNHSFSNCDCFHCAILKALYDFNEERADKADRQETCNFFLQNVQKENFKILEKFENNMKFTGEACRINSEISNWNKTITLVIFLFCNYCWSLLWWNYWKSSMLWNSTSWCRLKYQRRKVGLEMDDMLSCTRRGCYFLINRI